MLFIRKMLIWSSKLSTYDSPFFRFCLCFFFFLFFFFLFFFFFFVFFFFSFFFFFCFFFFSFFLFLLLFGALMFPCLFGLFPLRFTLAKRPQLRIDVVGRELVPSWFPTFASASLWPLRKVGKDKRTLLERLSPLSLTVHLHDTFPPFLIFSVAVSTSTSFPSYTNA